MADLDLTAAIDAAAAALWDWTMNDDPAVQPEPWRLADADDKQRCQEAARILLTAALPHIREQLAQELEARRKHYKDVLGMQPRQLRDFDTCIAIARGPMGKESADAAPVVHHPV